MGHYDGFCFLSLCSLAIVLISHVTGDYLVLFRGKSKHTALIAPFDKWILPEEELKSCYGRSFIERYLFHPDSLPIGKGDTFRRLVVQNTNSSTVDLHEVKVEPSLMFACQKCILLHGLFEIWSEGNSIDEVVAKAGISEQYLEFSKRCEQQCESSSVHRSVSFRIAASVLEQPWLPSETLNESILSKFDNMWCKLITAPTNRLNSVDNGAVLDFDMRVYVDEVSGYCVLCRHLARGLAAPSKSGEGGRDPLPITGSLRRPLSGVLNTFALKSLPYRSPTAMEPEIAFLMANLAEVGPHSRVLDPYAGCCSLLLAAGFLQEMEPPCHHTQKMEKSDGCLVGVDASMGEDTEPIWSNFAAVGLSSRLTSLSLRWDIAERLIKRHQHFNSDVLDGTHNQTHGEGILSTLPEGFAFDAIITDPPYNMAEAVQHRKSKQAPPREERSNWTPHTATDVECAEMLDVSSASATMSTYSPSTTSSFSPSSSSPSSSSSSSSPSSSSLSAAVDTNIMTLLRLASETLRVGGKLVFFAPHRESDGSRGGGRGDQLNRGDRARKYVPATAHAEQQGDGFEERISDFTAIESASDQQKLIGDRVQTKIEALTEDRVAYDAEGVMDDTSPPGASYGPSQSDQEGVEGQKGGSVLPGMGLKMSKRKAFKKRARITKDEDGESSLLPRATPIDMGTSRSMSRTAPTSPLDFLPLLPDSLTLVGYHEQVMSPSFSRWLCVIQKV